jgi:tetratricopeptide (TPR) repeat protein
MVEGEAPVSGSSTQGLAFMSRYALVIGIQKYSGSGFQDLEKSAKDAEAVAQLLGTHGDWMVTRLPQIWSGEKDSYEVAAGVDLTGADLGTKLRQFFEQVGRNEALVYFSGHGHEVTDVLGEKSGYLVASDCTEATVSNQGLSLESFNKLILNADCSSVVVLLDCCHAGRLLEKGLINRALTAFNQGDRNYFLATACRGHEKAYEGPDFSLFTAALLKGLATPGRDGRVRTPDLDKALSEGLSGSGQEPVTLKSGGEIILATYGAGIESRPVKEGALQSVLAQLCTEGIYDALDAAFFEAVAARVASSQARAQVLRLRAANWSMLFQGNYVERDQQWEALQQAQQLAQQSGISLMMIRGEPGAGKTALSRWLAYELFRQGKRVLHRKISSQVGWLEELRAVSEAAKGEHFYVIADDVFQDEAILEELQQTELWFPFTLIATTRPNEDRHAELDGMGYETACLDLLKPSRAEKERILALPEVESHLAGKSAAEREELLDSPIMLVLMLQLSEGKPFDALLRDIVKELPNSNNRPIYQAFGALCSFFQYNIAVPFEILCLCLPAGNWSEQLILTELEGLVEIATYAGYEGLFPIHELIATTVMTLDYKQGEANPPYACQPWQQPPLLEQNLRKIILTLDAAKETQKRWLCNTIRHLAANSSANLVRSVLQDYREQVESVQTQDDSISSWFYWLKVYTSLNWKADQERCLDALLNTQPKIQWEWVRWLSLISKFGVSEQKQAAITTTQAWLDQHPEDSNVREQYLAFLSQWGTSEQKQAAIAPTQAWLDQHPEDSNVRKQYLVFLSQWGTSEQKQAAIKPTQAWLKHHPEDNSVRTQYLVFLSQWGTSEQKQAAITPTQAWLEHHPENSYVRTQYLAFLSQWGTSEQKQAAIKPTQAWLEHHPENSNVRTQYLSFLGKQGSDIEEIVDLVGKQWQWIIGHAQVSGDVWTAFLPTLYHHASPDLYQPAIALVLQHHPNNSWLNKIVFGYFRDYLDHADCYALATHVSESRLPHNKWQNYIHAANFFRDQGELEKAEKIYLRTFGAARGRVSEDPSLAKTIDLINLSYAQLLLHTDPPRSEEAIKKLSFILKKIPKHGYAHLLMAQAYQAKGESFYIKAKNHFENAIKFDHWGDGYMYCQFGCFYRYAIGNVPTARDCFKRSIDQQANLPACLELAELEVADGNLERAKLLLEAGLALPLLTRPEKEMKEKLGDRIAVLRQQMY